MTAAFDPAICLARIRGGDEAEARRFVEVTAPLVAKIVRAYVPKHLDRAACEQDTYLRAFSRCDQYRSEAPLEHWLSRIAVRVCLDALRRHRRRPELRRSDLDDREQVALDAASRDDPRSTPAAAAARDLVEKLLTSLDPEDALIVRMLDMEERSTEEIARLLGRTRTAVKVRAFRARRRLRAALDRLSSERPLE